MSRNTEHVTHVTFPAPSDLNVNMMPFVIGDADSIPAPLRGYQPLIDACDIESAEHGKVGYLTVTESAVTPQGSQRRGGAHVERHPQGSWGGGGWGAGAFGQRRLGGLYLASNMAATTAVWDARVEVPGPGGDCSHLLSQLGDPSVLEAGELVWLTDACPHESLAPTQSGIRQFFRVVTSEVDLWFTEHSTANPLGVTPPEHVTLVCGSKFSS